MLSLNKALYSFNETATYIIFVYLDSNVNPQSFFPSKFFLTTAMFIKGYTQTIPCEFLHIQKIWK